MNVDHPWQVDGRGRTAVTDDRDHLADLVRQVVLTAPGERVMRPDFGSGLLGLPFEPAGPEVAATTQVLVQAALQQWLGDRIAVEAVEVRHDDATLAVTVRYVATRTGEAATTEVRKAAP